MQPAPEEGGKHAYASGGPPEQCLRRDGTSCWPGTSHSWVPSSPPPPLFSTCFPPLFGRTAGGVATGQRVWVFHARVDPFHIDPSLFRTILTMLADPECEPKTVQIKRSAITIARDDGDDEFGLIFTCTASPYERFTQEIREMRLEQFVAFVREHASRTMPFMLHHVVTSTPSRITARPSHLANVSQSVRDAFGPDVLLLHPTKDGCYIGHEWAPTDAVRDVVGYLPAPGTPRRFVIDAAWRDVVTEGKGKETKKRVIRVRRADVENALRAVFFSHDTWTKRQYATPDALLKDSGNWWTFSADEDWLLARTHNRKQIMLANELAATVPPAATTPITHRTSPHQGSSSRRKRPLGDGDKEAERVLDNWYKPTGNQPAGSNARDVGDASAAQMLVQMSSTSPSGSEGGGGGGGEEGRDGAAEASEDSVEEDHTAWERVKPPVDTEDDLRMTLTTQIDMVIKTESERLRVAWINEKIVAVREEDATDPLTNWVRRMDELETASREPLATARFRQRARDSVEPLVAAKASYAQAVLIWTSAVRAFARQGRRTAAASDAAVRGAIDALTKARANLSQARDAAHEALRAAAA